MKPKLQVCRVSFSYHSKHKETLALSDISFTVEHGEFVAILGPSGCGKSTLLSLICGLDEPEAGAIFLDGELLEKNPVTKNAVAILQAKYPGLSRTQAYEDCRNAVRMFNSKQTFDYELWRNWLLNDIIELCQKAKDTGNLKAWAAAQANLIKALGEAPENNIDPRLLEKHQIVIPIQVNNNTYNLDLNKFLNIPIDQRTRIADALINPATDDDITEIMNS